MPLNKGHRVSERMPRNQNLSFNSHSVPRSFPHLSELQELICFCSQRHRTPPKEWQWSRRRKQENWSPTVPNLHTARCHFFRPNPCLCFFPSFQNPGTRHPKPVYPYTSNFQSYSPIR